MTDAVQAAYAECAAICDQIGTDWGKDVQQVANVIRNIILARAAVVAAKAEPVGVRVKPLVWRDLGPYSEAECRLGVAAVQTEATDRSPDRYGWWMAGSHEDDMPSGYAIGRDAAKAAAQADYEARILAALEPSTPLPGDRDE
jgi:hypothetical protein